MYDRPRSTKWHGVLACRACSVLICTNQIQESTLFVAELCAFTWNAVLRTFFERSRMVRFVYRREHPAFTLPPVENVPGGYHLAMTEQILTSENRGPLDCGNHGYYVLPTGSITLLVIRLRLLRANRRKRCWKPHSKTSSYS